MWKHVAAAVVVVGLMCSVASAGTVADDWWGMFEARSGVTYNFDAKAFAPYISVPVLAYKDVTGEVGFQFDVDADTEEDGPVGTVVAITYNLGDLKDFGVGLDWAKHFGVNIGPYFDYDFDTDDLSGGILFSLVDLSFDNGNVTRHEKATK